MFFIIILTAKKKKKKSNGEKDGEKQDKGELKKTRTIRKNKKKRKGLKNKSICIQAEEEGMKKKEI